MTEAGAMAPMVIERRVRSRLFRARRTRVVLGALAVLLVVAATMPGGSTATAATKPNILFVFTDDQRADTMNVMPLTVSNFPIVFTTGLVGDPNCCPSRSSTLTGEYVHDTHVFDNSTASYASFTARAADSLGPWLQSQGYFTGFIGKYFNAFSSSDPTPPGWNEFYGFNGLGAEDPNLNSYTHYFLKEHYFNGSQTVDQTVEHREYSTTLFSDLADRFIRRAENPTYNPQGKPWALLVWPKAPHSPQTPDVKYATASVPTWSKPPSFKEADMTDKPVDVRRLTVFKPDGFWLSTRANQLRTLMSVDDMVGRLFTTLGQLGLKNETYGFFSSDNGSFWGEHRLGGKWFGYEEAIKVPFRMWVPGVGSKSISALVANIDIAPTIMGLAGDPSLHHFDGKSIMGLVNGSQSKIRDELLLESYGGDKLGSSFVYNGVRTPQYAFIEWISGAQELYDLKVDPWQLNNVARTQPSIVSQLRARMLDLKND